MNSSDDLNRTISNNLTNTTNLYETSLGHKLSEQFVTSISIYFILLSFGGIVFNLVLIYTIATTRRLHSISNVLIVNMAVCDLITAVTGNISEKYVRSQASTFFV